MRMNLAAIASLAVVLTARAQQPALTMSQAVESALKNYPSIQVSEEQINAAAAGIQLARTAYLPRLDTIGQINRATRNNVFGLLLPQSVIPSISGPVLGTNNFGTAWGSAAGGLVSWEPFDFGLREANMAIAEKAKAQSQAALKRTEFDVAVATLDAYMTLAATQEAVTAAQAGVDRAGTVVRTISALVRSELRPGADASRADAELAAARTQLSQAEQAVEVARVTLAQFVGGETKPAIAAPALAQLPPEGAVAPLDPAANPIALEQAAVIEQAQAQLRALERSYFPKFYLQGSAYARGTGAEVNGKVLGGVNGLGPSVQNYAVGFTMNFSVFDIAAIHAREAQQSAAIRAQNARARQIATDLRAQWNRAVATYEGARKVAANTPVQVSAASTTLKQATARYQAGLANIDEVAEAQRLLTQAEIDDALARLSVWRALLAIATAAGDIQPFVAEAGK
jgi:outer membrane protein